MTAGRPRLSVVIPCYNEAHRLPEALRQCRAYFAGTDYAVELVLSDDGSVDGTLDGLPDLAPFGLGLAVVREPVNVGKGHAVARGVAAAEGKFILICDADMATPIAQVEKLWPHVGDGAMAIGSRGLPESSLEQRQPWYRETMGKMFNLVIRLLLNIPFRDTQCGFKLIPTPLAKDLFGNARCNGFAFDVELIVRAMKQGVRCTEIPVAWHHCGESKVHPIRDSLAMLREAFALLIRYGRL